MATQTGTILVVDDDFTNRTLLATSLEDQDYTVELAEDGLQALERLRAQSFDAVLLDLLMPGMDGFEVLTWIKANERLQHLPVIIISVVEDIQSVVRCIEMGATDYLPKPFDPVLLQARLNASLAAKRLHDQEHEYLRNVTLLTDAAAAVEGETFTPDSLTEVAARPDALGQLARVFQDMANEVHARQQYLQHQVQAASKDRYKFGLIIGKSPAMQAVYEQIVNVAATDSNVLICGESGTGKELVAQTIHNLSHRKAKEFVAVNCGAIPESLFESEFFGSRKGAFTGAIMDKQGYFDRAHKGTLFLDEVGELLPAMQVKLLRALQDKEYHALGDAATKSVDVRIIAATNRDMLEQLRQGAIRKDFFYRIRVIVINLPPLRERKEDVPLLIDAFLKEYGDDHNCTTLPPHLVTALCSYHWPGNIRELQNELQRYVVEQRLEFIGGYHSDGAELPLLSSDDAELEGRSLHEIVEACEKHVIARVLEQNQGHTDQTAAMLKIPLRTLYGKIKKYHLR